MYSRLVVHAMSNHPGLSVPLVYLLAAIPYAWLGLYAWRKRPAVAVRPFAWAMLGLSIWAFAYSLEILFPLLAAKLFFTNIEYIGVVSVPVFLLFFALEFIGKSHLLTLRARLFIWVIPLLTLILTWTNPLHHLMWQMETVTEIWGIKLLEFRFGPFFWIHVIYSYGLFLVANILFIMELIQRRGIHRMQISLVVLGIFILLAAKFAFITGVAPIRNLDITPLFFLPAALALSWAVIKYRLLEIIPLEHLTVLKNMKNGVIVLDQQQRIRYINPVAEGLMGRTENDVIGQPLAFASKIFGQKLIPYLTGVEQRAEIMIGEGKQAKVYEMSVSPLSSLNLIQGRSNTGSMITLHDVTERKETETALSRRELIMSAIGLTAELFLRESLWEPNIPGVLEKIGQAANVSRVFVAMNYTGDDGLIYSSLCYEWDAPGITSQINNPALQHVILREIGLGRWENTLSQGQPVFGMVREFPETEQKYLQSSGSISIAAMPIFVDTQWWGFIVFEECRNERRWSSTELEALHIAANIFGSAETRARTEQKLIRRQRALNLLHEIVKISLQAGNINDMAQSVVDRLGELINADGCFLTLWDDVKKRAIPLAAFGPQKDTYTSLKIQPGERTFTESALQQGHTLVVENTSTSSYVDPRVVENFPSQSVLVLPLIAIRKKLGAVILAFNNAHHFQADEISVSEQAASLIALALEKFQAMEQARKRADTSETLRKAGAVVTEKLEMDQTVSHILEQLNEVVPYTSASVQILEGNELHIVGGRGWENPADVIGLHFPVPGDNPNSIVIETGKPYRLPETWKVFKEFNEPPHDHIRSWLGVPLIFQEKITGLLAIDSSEANHFTEEDINIAAEFANQVAIALENARLFQETQNQAITDPLTGLYNRRGLFELGKIEFARSVRLNQPFSAIMLDLDHFKKINDTHGHFAGDLVLREFANRCKNCIREIDYVGRYGGEEIIILLPETSINASLVVAERLRAAIANKPIQINEGSELNITASLGVTSKDENTTSLEMLIARADQAMYVAKHKGRNRVAASH